MFITRADLARDWQPDAEHSRAVPGRVHQGLVREWVAVAGPALQLQVENALNTEGCSLLARDGRVPFAAYLRLHELIAELDHQNDGAAFADRWLRDVAAQISPVARLPLRALGPKRGLLLLPRLWPEVWCAPAPQLEFGKTSCMIGHFTGLPVDHPTLALLLVLQFELAMQLLTGGRGSVQVLDSKKLTLRLAW